MNIFSPWISAPVGVTFKTHLNYAKCMERLTDRLTIQINTRTEESLNPQIYSKFERLSDITKKSIDGEKTACELERGFSRVAAPWIPVKCYYKLYYLEAVFIYLLKGSVIGFNSGGHIGVRNAIKTSIRNNEISFAGVGAGNLTTITTWEEANLFKAIVGATITANYYQKNECDDSLRKKLSEYMEVDWKMKSGIKNYLTNTSKQKKREQLLPKQICLIDYFYWMRIKANYRDVDFLDFNNHVTEDEAYEYLESFIKATNNYEKSLKNAISSIKAARNMTIKL